MAETKTSPFSVENQLKEARMLQALAKIENTLDDCIFKLRALRTKLENKTDEESLQAHILLIQVTGNLLKALQKLEAFEKRYLKVKKNHPSKFQPVE